MAKKGAKFNHFPPKFKKETVEKYLSKEIGKDNNGGKKTGTVIEQTVVGLGQTLQGRSLTVEER